MGVRQAKAEKLTEGFESVSLTDANGNALASAWSYGYGLSNGWKVIGGSIYASAGSADYGLWTNAHEGSKSLEASYGSSNSAYVVISEKLTGEFKFWARKTSSSSSTKGTIKLFVAEENGDSYTVTSTKLYENSSLTTTWTEYTVDLGNEGVYVAINMIRAGIDDIEAEIFEDGAEKKAIGISAFVANETSLNTDEEGKYNASFTVTVENKGNVALTAEDNATVSLLDANKNVIATSEAIALDVNGSTEITLNYEGTATADGDITFYVKENMTDKQFATAATINVQLAGARFAIDNDGSAQDFGFNALGGTSEKSYTVSNNGNTSMNVTIAAPEGYTVNPSTLTVEAGASADFIVALTTTTAGNKAGNVVVTSDAIDVQTFNIPVSGYIYADGVEHVDFSALPEGWTKAGNTSISDGVADFYYGTSNTIETPAIEFTEGNVLAIRGMLRSSYGELTVKGSTDGGSTWSYSKDVTGFNNNAYTTVELSDIPAEVNKLQFVGYYFYMDDLAGFNYNQNAPKLEVSFDGATIATGYADNFGKVKATTTHTYTVKNGGTGTLNVTITSSDAAFTVAPESLELAKGEEGTFDVTLVFDENYGEKSATISVVPSYDEAAAVEINATATTSDPNVWEEDFQSSTAMPSFWINNGWTISRKWNEDSSVNHAYSGTSNDNTLVTPPLIATKGQVLQFEVIDPETSYPLTVEWSHDGNTWTEYTKVTSDGVQEFTAPEDGNYYIRFSGRYIYIDNFCGFKLNLPEHYATISANNIPATGTQFAEYTATATVKELVGVEEAATAKLYVNGEEVATATETVPANGTATFTLTYVPEEAIEDGVAKIVVTYAGGELATDEATVTIAAAPVLDETVASEITTGTVDALVLKYTPKAGWNTICVPFALTENILNQIFGEGWKAYEYKGYSNGEFTFSKATFFAAGYPYLVFAQDPQAAADGFKIENVNITAATENSDSYGGATFQGTYAPMAAGTMEGKYGVVPNAEDIPSIKKGGANATLKGYHGYFEIPAGGGVKGFSFTLVDDATGISQFVATPVNGAIYDLNGNKVKNLVKGQVYIMNGQKILVK